MTLPRTKLQRALEILTVIALAAQFLAPIVRWSGLPDPMPIHYNAAGEADGWGSRWTVFLIPVISLIGCAIIGLVIYRTKPEDWGLPYSVPPQRKVQVYSPIKTSLIGLNLEMSLMFGVINGFLLAMTTDGLMTATVLLLLAMAATLAAGLWKGWQGRFWG